MKRPGSHPQLVESLLAQQKQCARGNEDCKGFRCARCVRGREYGRRHPGGAS